jgi:hypothetical protein
MPIYKSDSSLTGSLRGGVEISEGRSLSPVPPANSTMVDGKAFLRTHKKPMSAVVEGLTHSQGSIALISVMCAGFAFQGFTTQEFEYDSLSKYHQIVYIGKKMKRRSYSRVLEMQLTPPNSSPPHPFSLSCAAFVVTTSLTIASFLFVAVSCSLLEQNGIVARSLAISYDVAPDFDLSLKDWYMAPSFANFRRNLIYIFTGSFPLFALFVALFCILKMPFIIGETCAAIFIFFGFVIVVSVMVNNKRFVNEVLKKSK